MIFDPTFKRSFLPKPFKQVVSQAVLPGVYLGPGINMSPAFIQIHMGTNYTHKYT